MTETEHGEDSGQDLAAAIQKARDVEESESPSAQFDELLKDPEFSRFADEVAVLRAAYSDTEKLQVDVSDYIAECTDEIKSNKRIRLSAAIAAGVLCIILVGSALMHAQWLTEQKEPGVAWQVSAALISLSLSAATALVLVVVRSAFQSYSERNSASPIPDQLKEFTDQLNKLLSGN